MLRSYIFCHMACIFLRWEDIKKKVSFFWEISKGGGPVVELHPKGFAINEATPSSFQKEVKWLPNLKKRFD